MKKALFIGALLAFACAQAAIDLEKNTATTVVIGPFYDGVDGVTSEESLTVTQWDCDIVKDTAVGIDIDSLTITASGGDNDASHLVNGLYTLELTAANLNGDSFARLVCDHPTATTFVPVWHDYKLVDSQPYDSRYDGDNLQVDTVQIGGTTQTANDASGDVDTVLTRLTAARAGYLDNLNVGGNVATSAAQTTAQSDLNILTGTDGATLATSQPNYAPLQPTVTGRTLDVTTTGESGVDLDNVNGTLDAAEIGTAAIGDAELDVTGSEFTAIPWNAGWDSEVESEALDANNVYNAPTSGEFDTKIPQKFTFDDVGGVQMPRVNVEGWNATEITEAPLEATDLGIVTGTVSGVTNQTTITLSAGVAQDDIYNGWEISIMDHTASDIPSCSRIIKNWTSGLIATLDSACYNYTIAPSNIFQLECKTACSRLDVDNW